MSVTKSVFGTTGDGRQVEKFVLSSENGIEIHCTNYGCRITNVLLPDKKGNKTDIVLGFNTLEEYEKDTSFQGTFVGRYANRISGGKFTLNGVETQVAQNENGNFLHGSLHKAVFDVEVIGENSISFTYTSPDGEDGFPGEVWFGVIYTLTDQSELVMDYRAVATEDTVVNLTNHSYFNLAGEGTVDLSGQTLWLGSQEFLEAGENLCPTGRRLEVAGGAFDFREEKPILRDIGAFDPQIIIGKGYDHCFIIEKLRPAALAMAAIARHPASGRTLRVFTTQPGVQLYTGNYLDGTQLGKSGKPLGKRSGFCLETQHFPDSPNQPEFPSTLLEAGQKMHEITVWQFQNEQDR